MRARAYDPLTARFIGRDTFAGIASAPQTGNRYAYALANPLRYTDPSGRFVNKVLTNPTVVLTALSLFPPTSLVGFGGRFLLTAFAGITALTGVDPLTGEPVEGPARLLAGAVFLGPLAGKVLSAAGEAWALAGANAERAGGGLRGLLADARSGLSDLRAAYRESALGSEAGAIRLGREAEADLPDPLKVGYNARTGVDVYLGVRDARPVYAGITNNIEARAAQHGGRFDQLDRLTLAPVTGGEARAIEEALIVRNAGFENIRHSISPLHSYYADAVDWGEAWLLRHGY